MAITSARLRGHIRRAVSHKGFLYSTVLPSTKVSSFLTGGGCLTETSHNSGTTALYWKFTSLLEKVTVISDVKPIIYIYIFVYNRRSPSLACSKKYTLYLPLYGWSGSWNEDAIKEMRERTVTWQQGTMVRLYSRWANYRRVIDQQPGQPLIQFSLILVKWTLPSLNMKHTAKEIPNMYVHQWGSWHFQKLAVLPRYYCLVNLYGLINSLGQLTQGQQWGSSSNKMYMI